MFKNQVSYQALRDICSERTNPLVIWIGAGLSREAGLPSWTELQHQLESALRAKADTLDADGADRAIGKLKSAQEAANPWLAFQILEDGLGDATFRDIVRGSLNKAIAAKLPDAYKKLWRLRPRGILTLNLDRLATRAYSELRPGAMLHEFSGRDAGHHLHLLKSPQPFVVNLHGVSEDSASWILTRRSFKQLFLDEGYQQFIKTSLVAHTVVFVGITANDIAVGGHVEQLTKLGLDTGSHFWITHRNDRDTDNWAEAAGIRLVTYDPKGDHRELVELLSDLVGYVPPEPVPKPITLHEPGPLPALPSPADLEHSSSETIRHVLNAHASHILSDETTDSLRRYDDFLIAYDSAVYRAWYVTTVPPGNVLHGYTLEKEVGAPGAFGRVFRATSSRTGEVVAIKVLHQEVRRTRGMLDNFRRGVRSMRILSSRRVAGMVPYREASEIPAFAVMDFIDGPNLKEAVESNYVDDWPTLLRIAKTLTSIIRSGHMLPERVLHRDIRPANVMLRHYYTDPTGYDVVVLDFDLSWHRGAIEKSIVASANVALGYLAPEQLASIPGESTRNAAVDSFGLGMTFLFMAERRDPVVNEHLQRDWVKQRERQIARMRPSKRWESLPIRFARLIDMATKQRQVERWDVGQIDSELDRLVEAERAPENVQSAELWAEELLFRSGAVEEYHWDADQIRASFSLPTGMGVTVSGRDVADEVKAHLSWLSRGQDDWRSVGKWIGPAADRAAAALRGGGWSVVRAEHRKEEATVDAAISVATLRREAGRASRGLADAIDQLRLN